MAPSPMLRPDPRPVDPPVDEDVPSVHIDLDSLAAEDPATGDAQRGGTIIDVDSLDTEVVLQRLAAAPKPSSLTAPRTPHPPRLGAVAELVALCVAPTAWVGAVALVPMSETASGAAVAGGWVAMAAAVQWWTSRRGRDDP